MPTIKVTTELFVACGKCQAVIMLSRSFASRTKLTNKAFYCQAGHENHWPQEEHEKAIEDAIKAAEYILKLQHENAELIQSFDAANKHLEELNQMSRKMEGAYYARLSLAQSGRFSVMGKLGNATKKIRRIEGRGKE